MNRTFIAFFAFVICALNTTYVLGHSGPVHEQEMLSVFGISAEDKELRERMHPTIEVFRKQIDGDWHILYNQIKEVMHPARFSFGTYGHRLLFHWGFNADPRHSEPLQKCMSAATTDPQLIEKGYQCILREQARRNREMLLAVGWLSPAPRKQHNAIASILYDTHIIGDYIEGKPGPQSAMIPLKEVVDDIVKHGVMNFDCDYNLRFECKKAIESAYRSASADAMKAQAVLNAMRAQIPKCVANSKVIKRIVWGDKTPSKIDCKTETPSSQSAPEGFVDDIFGTDFGF